MNRDFKYYSFLLLLIASVGGFAQQEILTAGYENGTNFNILYRTQRVGKVFGTPRGWGFAYRTVKQQTSKKSYFYEFDFQNLRHPKEKKVVGQASFRKRYKYGKLNSILEVRAAFGYQHVLARKADSKAVEVRYAYSIGPTIALAKPYYLTVLDRNGNDSLIKFDSKNFNAAASVVGRSAFANGLDQLKLIPGASARFNLSFEYAPYTNLVRAIETGICLDIYPQSLVIMANNPAERFIITFNVGFVFGRKWF